MAKTAYDKLGITHDAVLRQRSIRHELRRMMAATADMINAPTDPYYYLSISDDPDARRILDVYYTISEWQRRSISIEAYCLAAGVSTTRCLAVVAAAMVQSGADAQRVVAAVAMPAVVTEVIKRALDGDRDDCTENATLLAKATGFLPSPRGNHTSIQVNANAKADATAATQIAVVAAPSPEQTIRRAVDRFNERVAGALPVATVEPAALPESSAVPIPRPDITLREAITVELDDPPDDDSDQDDV